jgi:hypothetical protein
MAPSVSTHERGGKRGLGAGVATADDNDIEFFGVPHGWKSVSRLKELLWVMGARILFVGRLGCQPD